MTKLFAFLESHCHGSDKEFHRNDPGLARHVFSNNSIGLLVTRVTLMCCMWICFMPSISQAANTFAITGPLATARKGHTATLLPNGKVLVAGVDNSGYLAGAELYDPGTGT